MNKRSHIHKKADSSASNPVHSQLQSRPFIAQAQPQSSKPISKTETETQEFQQHNSEATKLKLQAKYGTITPEGQERLTVLQAKISSTLQRRLEHASSKGSNFAHIPISRPDAPSQLAVQTKLTIGKPGDKFEQQANRVAAQVVNQINAPISPQARQSQPVQREEMSEPSEVHQENKTGLPDNLKAGIENLSGISMDDVKVHYNSPKPAQLQALAYAQGTDIHVAPGQEKHLGHEAWHIAQQKQGRVKPTMQVKGVAINDDTSLEREADVMGAKAVSAHAHQLRRVVQENGGAVQRVQKQATQPTIDVNQRVDNDNTGNTANIVSAAAVGLAGAVVYWMYNALKKDNRIRKEQYTNVIANIPQVAQEIFDSARAASDADQEHVVDQNLKAWVAQGALLARNEQMETVRASISKIGQTLSEFMKSQGKTYEELYQKYNTQGASDDDVNMKIISAAGRANPALLSKFLGKFVGQS